MAWALLIVMLLVLFLAAGVEQSRSRAKAPPTPPPAEDGGADVEEYDDPVELALNDPIEALQRYGVPEDAERLREAGIDLGKLGYRPPE